MRSSLRRNVLAASLPIVTSLAAGIAPRNIHAQEEEPAVPAELQFTLLAKMLTFDRNLAQRVGVELVIGLVHQPGYPASRDFAREMQEAWRRTSIRTIGDVPIRFILVPLGAEDALSRALLANEVDIAFVAPLRAVSIERVLQAAGAAGASTVAAIPDWVERGAALGFGLREGRPLMRIHLTGARAAHHDFEAGLLRLAEVVR